MSNVNTMPCAKWAYDGLLKHDDKRQKTVKARLIYIYIGRNETNIKQKSSNKWIQND